MHTCVSCGNVFENKFCNNCGEKVITEKDRSVAHFIEESVHFITHLDGKLFTTLKTMVVQPGKLSADYCRGARRNYFKPLSLFLLLVIIYLIFPYFQGLNMQLKYYPKQDFYGNYAAQKIASVQANTGYDFEELSQKYHQKSEKVSKFMMLAIIPFTGLVLWLIGYKKRRLFYDNFVLSAEINSFFLIWGFLVLPLILTLLFKLLSLFGLDNLFVGDEGLTIMIYGAFVVYVTRSFNFYYKFKWYFNIPLICFFLFAHNIIVYSLYKFLLFVATINQIH